MSEEDSVKARGVLPMELNCAAYSSIGKRKNNEDSYGVHHEGQAFLALVADGLGGHEHGELASKKAVDTIIGLLKNEELSEETLEDAILEADALVKQTQNGKSNGMTTVAVLWMDDRNAVAAHVGDTRIYQFRNGAILFQSVDHSVSQVAVMAGEITPQDIRSHKDRNKLIRVLGSAEEARTDIRWLAVQPGDRFLLCSDGFWEPVTEEYMLASAARHHDAESWLADMRSVAEPAASDNNTAVAIIVP